MGQKPLSLEHVKVGEYYIIKFRQDTWITLPGTAWKTNSLWDAQVMMRANQFYPAKVINIKRNMLILSFYISGNVNGWYYHWAVFDDIIIKGKMAARHWKQIKKKMFADWL